MTKEQLLEMINDTTAEARDVADLIAEAFIEYEVSRELQKADEAYATFFSLVYNVMGRLIYAADLPLAEEEEAWLELLENEDIQYVINRAGGEKWHH